MESITIRVFDARVTRGAAEVALSDREMQVAFALASEPHPIGPKQLGRKLWGDAGGAVAAKVYVHRLRQRLGLQTILTSRYGYQLRNDVNVDLKQLEKFMNKRSPASSMSASQRAYVNRTYQKLLIGRPKHMMNWEWFRDVDDRLHRLTARLGTLLAWDALERADQDGCLQIVESLIESGIKDDTTPEQQVRQFLADGQSAMALSILKGLCGFTEIGRFSDAR